MTCPDCNERPTEKRGVCGRCYQRRRRRRLGKRELVLRFPTSITVSMSDELEAFLRHQARAAGLQVSVFVRQLLVGYAERLKVAPDTKALPGAVGPVLNGTLGKVGELVPVGIPRPVSPRNLHGL